MDGEYRAALARVEVEQRANPAPLTSEQIRLRRVEEHERRQRERDAAAYRAENDRLHRDHVERMAAAEGDRHRFEAERLAEARERLRPDFFRRFPLAAEADFQRALPRLIEADEAATLDAETRALLASSAYARF